MFAGRTDHHQEEAANLAEALLYHLEYCNHIQDMPTLSKAKYGIEQGEQQSGQAVLVIPHNVTIRLFSLGLCHPRAQYY